VVKEKNSAKEIQLEYSFDRLSAKKIAQAYKLLVSERVWTTGARDECVKSRGEGDKYEDSSDLRTGVLRATERRTNHW
jgi:hypothetical protein